MRCIKFSETNIQTDHPILARRPDLQLINKKKRTCQLIGFAISAEQRENERKQKDRQIFGSCQRAEKVVEHWY